MYANVRRHRAAPPWHINRMILEQCIFIMMNIGQQTANHNLIHVDTNMIDDTYANVEDTCGCLDDRFGLSRYNPEIMLGIERRCFIKARFVALYNYY